MGVLDRLILRDDQWERMSQHIIGGERARDSSGRDNRMFVEAVLWIVRTGSPRRDLSEVFDEEQRLKPLEPQVYLVTHFRGDVGRS